MTEPTFEGQVRLDEFGPAALARAAGAVANAAGVTVASVTSLDGGVHRVVASVGENRLGDVIAVEDQPHCALTGEDGQLIGAVLFSAPPATSPDVSLLAARLELYRTKRLGWQAAQETLDQAGLGTWTVDPRNGLASTSPLLRFMFGMPEDTPEWAPAEHYIANMHPDDRETVTEALQRAIATGDPFLVECRITGRDGKERWVMSRSVVHRDASGAVDALSGAIVDISIRKRFEQERERLAQELASAADANAKFRTFFEQGSYFAGVLTLDGTVVEANRLSLIACGFARDDVIGRPFWECGWWNRSPELQEMVREGIRIARQGAIFRTECEYFVADGSVRIVDLVIAPVKDEEGRVLFLAPTGTDVTDRRRVDARDRFLVELDDAIRPLSDPGDVTLTAARLLGEHLRADRCAYADIEDDEDTMNLSGNYMSRPEIHSIVGRLRFRDFGEEILALMRANQPFVVEDVDTHQPPVGDPAAYRATQIQAVICVPLHKRGRFVAAMAVHCATPRKWRAEEVELVQLVAARCWESIERVRILRNLRESEERYRTLFERIDEGFCIIEVLFDDAGRAHDYRFLEVNPAFERLTGIPNESARTGLSVREMYPDFDDVWIQAYGTVVRTGEPVRLEEYSEALGRWFDVSGVRVGGEGSTRVAVVFNDITSRKEHERERERLVSELTVEREKLEGIFEQAPAFLALLQGPDLTFEYVNPAYKLLLGDRPLVGLPVRDAVPEVAGQGFFEILEQVMKTGEPYVGRGVSLHLQPERGGPFEERILDFVYQPVRQTDGTVYGILAHGVDVTEQALARQAIAQSEEQFRTVFENAGDDAIILFDTELRVVAWNPAAERVCGWKAAEALGQYGDFFYTELDRRNSVPFQEAQLAAREGKAPNERWHQHRDGHLFWGSGTLSALYQKDGKVRGFLKVFRDATERHEMEQRIRALNEELEQRVAERTSALVAKNQELEGFSYSIAHDMRAPLRAIVANSRIVLDEEGPRLSDDGRYQLERLAKGALKMAQLVDDLLQYARLGTRELRKEPTDIASLARKIADDVARDRGACDVRFGIHADTNADCDPMLVGMALYNLLDNACKYHSKDEDAQIEFLCEMQEDERVFCVRDHGIGFDMRYVGKLFVPFERLHREEYEGTGIGLANVKRAIERHGGRVWAEGNPGQGASFYFTLP